MPLPNLLRTPRIHILRVFQERPLRKAGFGAQRERTPTLEEQYKDFPPPFNSSWEWYIWQYIRKQNASWEVQQTFGGKGAKGSTRVDFLNQQLAIAFFPDGTYWHVGDRKEGRDILNRAQLRANGWRVVQWLITDFDQVVRDLPTFYRRMVFGR